MPASHLPVRRLAGVLVTAVGLATATGCGSGTSEAASTVTVTAPAVTVTAGDPPSPSTTSGSASTSTTSTASATSATSTTTAPAPSTSTPAPSSTAPAGVTLATFDRTAFDYLRTRKGAYGVVAADLTTGRTVQHNPGQRCETASMVKLDVLLTMLLQHQDRHEEFDGSDRALTRSMIIYSDNDATTQLWGRVGGDQGVREANEKFGMTETEPGTQYRWGLTTTTAADQVRLLRNLVKDGPLTPESRNYALDLMSQVSEGQDWGVSAANPQHEARLKNGWLPHGDGWIVTSAGRVQTGKKHDVLMSVVSCHGASQPGSIETIEHLARLAAQALES